MKEKKKTHWNRNSPVEVAIYVIFNALFKSSTCVHNAYHIVDANFFVGVLPCITYLPIAQVVVKQSLRVLISG
jgi:hypothetical protein